MVGNLPHHVFFVKKTLDLRLKMIYNKYKQRKNAIHAATSLLIVMALINNKYSGVVL